MQTPRRPDSRRGVENAYISDYAAIIAEDTEDEQEVRANWPPSRLRLLHRVPWVPPPPQDDIIRTAQLHYPTRPEAASLPDTNLDVLFTSMYHYFFERGFGVIVAKQVTNLM